MSDTRNMSQYSPEGIEDRWYREWEGAGLFAPDQDLPGEPFVIT